MALLFSVCYIFLSCSNRFVVCHYNCISTPRCLFATLLSRVCLPPVCVVCLVREFVSVRLCKLGFYTVYCAFCVFALRHAKKNTKILLIYNKLKKEAKRLWLQHIPTTTTSTNRTINILNMCVIHAVIIILLIW